MKRGLDKVRYKELTKLRDGKPTKVKLYRRRVGYKRMQRDFDPENYVRAFRMARDGFNDSQMAKAFGINLKTFQSWRANDPAFDKAIMDGLPLAKSGKVARHDKGHPELKSKETLADYIYGRLSPDLQRLWDKLHRLDNSKPSSAERIRLFMRDQSTVRRQQLWLHAYVKCNFSKSDACRVTGVTPQTTRQWEQDARFKRLVDGVVEAKKDFVESALIELIRSGDTNAIVFAAKTLLRDRGYDPKVTIRHEGEVRHTVEIETILKRMPLKARKAALKAIEQVRGPKALPAHKSEEDIVDAEFEEIRED